MNLGREYLYYVGGTIQGRYHPKLYVESFLHSRSKVLSNYMNEKE